MKIKQLVFIAFLLGCDDSPSIEQLRQTNQQLEQCNKQLGRAVGCLEGLKRMFELDGAWTRKVACRVAKQPTDCMPDPEQMRYFIDQVCPTPACAEPKAQP